MGVFDLLDEVLSETVDVVHETPFTLTPMFEPPNSRAVVDETRPVIEAFGIFDYVETEFGIELGVRKSYREANDLRALQSGREPRLSVDRKWFPTLKDEPRQGDIIEFSNKPDLPRFQIVAVRRDGMSRLAIWLVHLGRQA